MHSPFSTSLHLTLIPYSPPIQLFGALAAMKEYVLSIKDSSKVTWTQLLWCYILIIYSVLFLTFHIAHIVMEVMMHSLLESLLYYDFPIIHGSPSAVPLSLAV